MRQEPGDAHGGGFAEHGDGQVPPARSTKAVTSVDLTTSPASRACSSRFCVGCSVCWELSWSSAMAIARYKKHRHGGGVVIQEHGDHRAQQRQHDHKAAHDVDAAPRQRRSAAAASAAPARPARHRPQSRTPGRARPAGSPAQRSDETSWITSCAMSAVGRCPPGGSMR